jgi:hypothetical protein
MVDTVDPDVNPADVVNTTWRNSDLSQTFTSTDATSGLADFTNDASFTLTASAESADADTPTVVSREVFDVAGNSTTRSVSAKIDLTSPSVGTIVDNNAASSNVCTTSSAPTQPTGFNPSDGLSGLNTSQTGQTWTEPGTSTHPYGTYTYEAHATDNAGNTDSYGPKNYSYTYGIGSGGLSYNGVLQPINMTGTPSIFKLGSTVPVKFTLACGQTSYGNAVANLFVKKSDSTVAGDVNEAISTSASTTGSLFRYDAMSGQYIFNLSTKSGYTDMNGNTQSFSAGTWIITIKFADGTTKTATFDIKK